MKITLLFFGVLAEVAGTDSLEMEFSGKINDLKTSVEKSYPKFGNYSYQISVNSELTRENKELRSGDTIAFLPPFAGG